MLSSATALIQKVPMTDKNLGKVIRPDHCRVSVSADITELAFTFGSREQAPITMVLPIFGAAGLQRQLAQCLYILGVTRMAVQNKPAAEACSDPD